jgi:hypothetical protein
VEPLNAVVKHAPLDRGARRPGGRIDATERIDTKILEALIDLDESGKLVPGLRVVSDIEASA